MYDFNITNVFTESDWGHNFSILLDVYKYIMFTWSTTIPELDYSSSGTLKFIQSSRHELLMYDVHSKIGSTWLRHFE